MESTNFSPLQEPQPEELISVGIDAQWTALKRFGVQMLPGVLPVQDIYTATGDTHWSQLCPPDGHGIRMPFGFSISATPNAIDIGPGIAFSAHSVAEVPTLADYGTTDTAVVAYDALNPVDRRMERIAILPGEVIAYTAAAPTAVDALGNSIPSSSGSRGVPGSGGANPSYVYDVYISYLRCVDTATVSGGSPVDNYTVSPVSGVVTYTQWKDGYRVHVHDHAAGYVASANDIYLGNFTLVTGIGVTNFSYTGRTYMRLEGALVKTALVPAATTSYVAGNLISLYDHINAVGDSTQVTAANPHGLSASGIAGLSEAISIYGNNPKNFHSNGIVNSSVTGAGPWFGAAVGRTVGAGSTQTVSLTLPGSSDWVYLDNQGFSRCSANAGDTTASYYYSEQLDSGNTTISLQAVDLSLPSPGMYCDFPLGCTSAGRAQDGYYGVYITALNTNPATGLAFPNPYTGTPLLNSDLSNKYVGVIRAQYVANAATSLATVISNMDSSLTAAGVINFLPIAVVKWTNATGLFTLLTDPDSAASVAALDMRRMGTIGSADLLTETRYDTSGGVDNRNTVVIDHNLKTLDISATGAVSATGDISTNGRVHEYAGTVNAGYVMPPGVTLPFAGPTAPNGFLLCDGTAYAQSTYPDLFAALGGVGSPWGHDATTFNVPKLCGRVPVGAGLADSGTTYNLGTTFGAENVTLTAAMLPDHTHTTQLPFRNLAGNSGGTPFFAYGAGTTNVNTLPYAGGGAAHENRPPSAVLNYIIKH